MWTSCSGGPPRRHRPEIPVASPRQYHHKNGACRDNGTGLPTCQRRPQSTLRPRETTILEVGDWGSSQGELSGVGDHHRHSGGCKHTIPPWECPGYGASMLEGSGEGGIWQSHQAGITWHLQLGQRTRDYPAILGFRVVCLFGFGLHWNQLPHSSFLFLLCETGMPVSLMPCCCSLEAHNLISQIHGCRANCLRMNLTYKLTLV